MLELDENLRAERHPVISLLLILAIVFIGFVVVGPLIGFVVSYPFFSGSLIEYASAIQNIPAHPEIKIPLYILQGSATLIGLIFAPMIYLRMEKRNIRGFFENDKIEILPLILTVVIVISFMVVDSVFIQWNESIQFPEFLKGFENWAKEKEEIAAEVTKMLTRFDSGGEVIIAFVVIAVLPAIGEELVFRGIIQNEFNRGTRNIHLSIWVSAILFSAIHMQFYGFVPRMLLGALFGYLYFWSGRLSIAILAHFVNNAFSVLGIYFAQRGYVDKDVVESTDALPWPNVTLGAVITIFLLYYFRRFYESKAIVS